MDAKQESLKRNEFKEILYDMADTQNILENDKGKLEIIARLEKLYDYGGKDGFRHFYSDIFSVLTIIHTKRKPGSIDVLTQNLEIIRNNYKPERCHDNQIIDISRKIDKLSDHLNLDAARIAYNDMSERKIFEDDLIKDIHTKMNKLSEKTDDLDAKRQSTETQIKSAQREYIAILGIFAAVVLAFTGGIAFSTSVFENMHQMSIYRVLIVSTIIGIVLVNILFGLFYYIDSLTNKNDKKSVKPLWISNVIFIFIALLIFIARGINLL